jgi:hypothetical protein
VGTGTIRNTYKIAVGNCEGNGTHGPPRRRSEYSIKWFLKELGWESVQCSGGQTVDRDLSVDRGQLFGRSRRFFFF